MVSSTTQRGLCPTPPGWVLGSQALRLPGDTEGPRGGPQTQHLSMSPDCSPRMISLALWIEEAARDLPTAGDKPKGRSSRQRRQPPKEND